MAKQEVGNDTYAAFMRRAVKAYGKRVSGDVEALAELAELDRLLEDATREAVAVLRSEEGGAYSWSEIGRVLGITKQAAAQRFAGVGGARRPGGQRAELR